MLIADTAGFPPTEIAALIAILASLLGVVVWLLDSLYVRRKAHAATRKEDIEKQQAYMENHLIDSRIWRAQMEAKTAELARVHDLLIAGPIKELQMTCNNISEVLKNFDNRAESRHEATMKAMLAFENRLTVVETRQQVLVKLSHE